MDLSLLFPLLFKFLREFEPLIILLCLSLALSILLLVLFFSISFLEKLDKLGTRIFECGFSSYYYSRFSFSIHFFLVSLIFLLLDLELCFFLPYFREFCRSFFLSINFFLFLMILFLGLLEEWGFGRLD